MYKIGVLGDKDSVLCFKAIGFEVRDVYDLPGASAALKELAESGCAVIFVIQEYYAALRTEIDRYRTSPLPAIISLPGREGSDGSGMAQIKAAVEKAIGSDIVG